MSAISRRAVLGYTGTAAAGTILAGAGTAHASDAGATPAQPATAKAQAQQATTTTEFPQGTEFSGSTSATFAGGDDDTEMTITFSVRWDMVDPGSHAVTPADIAQALNQLAQSKGWPAITFYGTPAPVALN